MASPDATNGTTIWKYIGTILGGFCSGPLHCLTKIEVADEVVWEGELYRADSPNPVTITIPDRGDIHLYWGTEDQVLSSEFQALAIAEGHIHPDYRSVCFVILDDFVFGVGVLSAPTVRLAGTRAPLQSLITGAATELVDGQANPFVAFAELLTNELFGLGHPLALFNAPSWQAAADAVIPRAPEVYVSLLIDSRSPARKIGANLLTMADGWLRAKRGEGTIEAGIFPPPESIVLAALDKIDYQSIDQNGNLVTTLETFDDVMTRCVVRFNDRDQLFKASSRKYDDPRARQTNAKAATLDLELPIVRAEQAQTQAQLNGRLSAMPRARHAAPVRAARYSTLQSGDNIYVDIDPTPGGAQLLQPCRVLSIERPSSGPANVNLESIPTLAPLSYVPAIEPGIPPTEEVPAIEVARIFEISPQAADGADAGLAILAERPHPLVTSLFIHYDSLESTGALYPRIASTGSYALCGALNADISAADVSFVVNIDGVLDREIIESSLGAVAARNDELLLIIIGTVHIIDIGGIFYSDRFVEILSVLDIAVTSTNQVTLTTFRGRLGTTARSASINNEAWFIRRSALPWCRHADFHDKANDGSLLYFKLQPATAIQSRDLAAITPLAFRYNSSRTFAPVIIPSAPANDSGQQYVSCALGTAIVFTGAVTDADANLTSLAVVLIRSGSEEIVGYHDYTRGSAVTYASSYKFTDAGIFQVVIRAKDSTGLVTEYTHNVHCAVSTVTRCAEPTFEETFTQMTWPGPYSVIIDWYKAYLIRCHCSTMAIDGGSSTTIKILTWVGPVGTPLEATTWTDHTPNTNPYLNGGSTRGQVYDSPMHQGEWVRIWAKAVDTAAVLADSFPVYVDCQR